MKTNLSHSPVTGVKRAVLLVTLACNLNVNSQTITTVAGTGNSGFSGDNGQAVSAMVNAVNGIVFDPAGNIYFSDVFNNRVRKITPAGIITTIAGNGSTAYATDGVAATSTGLNSPAGLALDAAGNLYIADQYNHCIRKVSTAGIITTVAGNGSTTYNGDGIAATSAGLFNPSGVAVNAAGDVYIADVLHSRIRKVNSAGIITTVAGTGIQNYTGDNGLATSATLDRAYAITLDAAGNLFIADDYNHCIRKVNTSGIITTVAGNGTAGFSGDGGQATAANMDLTSGVAVDAIGNIYVTDYNNSRVRKITATSGIITTLAGTGVFNYNGDNIPAATAQLNYPIGIACDALGNVYIGDAYNHRLRKVNTGCQSNPTITSTGDQTVTVTNSAQFVVSSTYTSSTYQWQLSQGGAFSNLGNGGQYSGVTTATLTISNTNLNNNNNQYRCLISGCVKDTSNVSRLTVQQPIGLKEYATGQNVFIYPNPARDIITVKSDVNISKIVIMDVTGRIVLETTLNENLLTIDVDKLAAGVYFLSGYTENQLINQEKLILTD